MSIPLRPNSVPMLNGQRYNNISRWSANQWYRIPESTWNAVRDNPTNNENGFIHILKWYLHNHFLKQLPRILQLQREYLADNPIHYWKSNKFKRADNRIASAFAQHVSDFKDGLLFGKKLKYGYSDPNGNKNTGKTFLQAVKDFNTSNDMHHHDAKLGLDALVTGRAYELSYIKAGTNEPRVVRLNPNQCFIIWNTDVEPKELCAVRYYVVRVARKSWYEIEVYNNNGNIYYFKTDSDDSDWQPTKPTAQNVYDDVPITEYLVNDTRQGCFENSMDYFDAYDKAISAMANSEEDFNNTTLVVSGKVHQPRKLTQLKVTGNKVFYKNGQPHTWSNMVLQSKDKQGRPNQPVLTFNHIPTKSNVLFLEPYIKNNEVVSQPSADYLTKELDADEWQVYVNELVTRIQQFTGVPNLNNDSSGNQTQLETASRLMDALNEAANAESNFRHGILRRLRLLYDYWKRLPGSPINADDSADPSNVTVSFDLNLPLNVQETIQKIQALNQTNKFSTETIQEVGEGLTHVPASQEANRLSSEQGAQSSANANQLNANFQQEIKASQASNAVNNAPNDSDESDGQSDTNSNASTADGHPVDSDSSSGDDNSDSSSVASDSGGSFSNPFVDSNGSATSEVMNPNSMFGSNGSVVSLNASQTDNMALAEAIWDSMQAQGLPSGFDSVMSSVVSVAASNSVSAAAAQSSALGGDIQS